MRGQPHFRFSVSIIDVNSIQTSRLLGNSAALRIARNRTRRLILPNQLTVDQYQYNLASVSLIISKKRGSKMSGSSAVLLRANRKITDDFTRFAKKKKPNFYLN